MKFRPLALVLFSLLATASLGCGSIDEDARISELDADERTEVCETYAPWDAKMCGGEKNLSRQAQTVAECIEELEEIQANLPNCDLTVGDLEVISSDDYCEEASAVVGKAILCALAGDNEG